MLNVAVVTLVHDASVEIQFNLCYGLASHLPLAVLSDLQTEDGSIMESMTEEGGLWSTRALSNMTKLEVQKIFGKSYAQLCLFPEPKQSSS